MGAGSKPAATRAVISVWKAAAKSGGLQCWAPNRNAARRRLGLVFIASRPLLLESLTPGLPNTTRCADRLNVGAVRSAFCKARRTLHHPLQPAAATAGWKWREHGFENGVVQANGRLIIDGSTRAKISLEFPFGMEAVARELLERQSHRQPWDSDG